MNISGASERKGGLTACHQEIFHVVVWKKTCFLHTLAYKACNFQGPIMWDKNYTPPLWDKKKVTYPPSLRRKKLNSPPPLNFTRSSCHINNEPSLRPTLSPARWYLPMLLIGEKKVTAFNLKFGSFRGLNLQSLTPFFKGPNFLYGYLNPFAERVLFWQFSVARLSSTKWPCP